MDYEEALEYRPTEAEVNEEIRKHGLDPEDFWGSYYGQPSEVTGEQVLGWLGY